MRGTEFQADLLHRIAVGQLFGDDHRSGRRQHAFDGGAADPDEVRIDQRVRTVDRAFIAAFAQRQEWQRARRSRTAGHDRVGLRRDDLQRLRGHRSIGTRIALVGEDLDAGGRGRLGQRAIDQIAPCVAEADIADALDAGLLHLPDHGRNHQRRRLRNADRPETAVTLASGRRQRRNGNERDFLFDGDRRHGDGSGDARCPDQHIDLLFLDKLAGTARGS